MNGITPTETATGTRGDWTASPLTDAEIVRLVLDGNDAAFEGIMRRYNRLLFRLARGIVGRDDEAKDVVQESYVRAYYRLAQFQGPDGFASWLSRIVVNEAITRTRRKSFNADDDRSSEEIPTDRQERPEDIAMSKDTLDLIEAAIDALPADFRVVFMLRAVEGLSVEETAELLDLKPATVKTRYFRARTQIRERLERRIHDAVPSSFSFDGPRCDAVVDAVFAAIAGNTPSAAS